MMMTRHLRAIAVATTIAVGASGAIAVGATKGPSPRSPKHNKSYKAGKRFTFQVRSTQPGAVFLKVSKSKKKGKDGTLRNDVYFRKMGRKKGTKTLYTKKAEGYPALKSYFLNKRGKYYWQAYRIDCSAQKDCNVEGRIRSFRIK